MSRGSSDGERIGLGAESGGDDAVEAGGAGGAGGAGAAGVFAEAGATDGSMDSDEGDEGDEAGPKSTSAPGTARAAPALGDDGKGRATADGNESPVAATDGNDLLLWRIRSRNEGRALRRGRSPGCMHNA